jgi:hypothetical protein
MCTAAVTGSRRFKNATFVRFFMGNADGRFAAINQRGTGMCAFRLAEHRRAFSESVSISRRTALAAFWIPR